MQTLNREDTKRKVNTQRVDTKRKVKTKGVNTEEAQEKYATIDRNINNQGSCLPNISDICSFNSIATTNSATKN